MQHRQLLTWLLAIGAASGATGTPAGVMALPAAGITANDLAVVINTADPLSVAIGDYYVRRRHIPAANIARVAFDYRRAVLPVDEFIALKRRIDVQLPASTQAYALTWSRPYRVECMSITSAFAFGFDSSYCATGCTTTLLSRYFNSVSKRPFDDLQMRPAMSLAADTIDQAEALIDRGIRADGQEPRGVAYLATSGDRTRDVRSSEYGDARMLVGRRIPVHLVTSGQVDGRSDVMFYFIGASRVSGIESNRFLPGAVADHLTSFGGVLGGGPQMSAMRWLEAGATGSYGTVVEPCNFLSKFPNVALLMQHYLAGETLIEAYWKSVAMPGQGIFIGEPLARPFGGAESR
jgi:uncharacterized protein (TIGR03790 family)